MREPVARRQGVQRVGLLEAAVLGRPMLVRYGAWLAALAIESGCEFVTTDRDYSRFPGLRWENPLQRP